MHMTASTHGGIFEGTAHEHQTNDRQAEAKTAKNEQAAPQALRAAIEAVAWSQAHQKAARWQLRRLMI
jgi:hypothetical protein